MFNVNYEKGKLGLICPIFVLIASCDGAGDLEASKGLIARNKVNQSVPIAVMPIPDASRDALGRSNITSNVSHVEARYRWKFVGVHKDQASIKNGDDQTLFASRVGLGIDFRISGFDLGDADFIIDGKTYLLTSPFDYARNDCSKLLSVANAISVSRAPSLIVRSKATGREAAFGTDGSQDVLGHMLTGAKCFD